MGELSDLEINKLVAEQRGLLVADEDFSGYNYNYRDKYPSTIWAAKQKDGVQIDAWEQMNFVLSPNDAWPIIVENEISLTAPEKVGEVPNWVAEYWKPNGKVYPCQFFGASENPLRAAMICYLRLNKKL